MGLTAILSERRPARAKLKTACSIEMKSSFMATDRLIGRCGQRTPRGRWKLITTAGIRSYPDKHPSFAITVSSATLRFDRSLPRFPCDAEDIRLAYQYSGVVTDDDVLPLQVDRY